MTALAKASSKYQRQTHPLSENMLYKDYSVEKIIDRESQGACHQDELIGSKLPVIKYLWL
jgi:hypothetical protein